MRNSRLQRSSGLSSVLFVTLSVLILFTSSTVFAQAADGLSTALTQAQQVQQAWVARYNGPNNSVDGASALTVDKQGNVYVTGSNRYTDTAGSQFHDDYVTLKYDSNGNLLWEQRYNSPGNAWGEDHALLALDEQRNIYVIGTSSEGDYTTLKYNPDGILLWEQRYNGPGNSGDFPTALAVDKQGNVYVTGRSEGNGTWYDYATLKYDSNGNLLWVQRYNGPDNNSDRPSAITVDARGNVYVAGTICMSSNSIGMCVNMDYSTLKYDPNGKLLWEQRYGTSNAWDEANALALDEQGNIYVTGSSEGDYATLKYDPNGSLLWVQRYSGPVNDYNYDGATALAVDEQGNIYVTGQSYGSDSTFDYATLKYDPDGSLLLAQRYSGPVNGYDSVTALAVDKQGNVYVTGSSQSNNPNDAYGIHIYDYATLKYDPNGNLLWVQRYNGTGNDQDFASALAVDKQGNVYVTGESMGNGTGPDYTTIKYSQ